MPQKNKRAERRRAASPGSDRMDVDSDGAESDEPELPRSGKRSRSEGPPARPLRRTRSPETPSAARGKRACGANFTHLRRVAEPVAGRKRTTTAESASAATKRTDPGADDSGRESADEDCCSICLEALRASDTVYIPCGHDFHLDCCLEWIGGHDTCPLCRDTISPETRAWVARFVQQRQAMLGRARRRPDI